MKVQKSTPTFQPISFQITIESDEELEAMQRMCRLNVSIPEQLSNENHQQVIYNFLNAINSQI
jgi:hypothetical protein